MKISIKKYSRLLILGIIFVGVVIYAAYFFELIKNYPNPEELPQEYIFTLSIDNDNLTLDLKTKQLYSSGCGFQIYLDKKIESNFAELEIRDVNTVPPGRVLCPDVATAPEPGRASVNLGSNRLTELTFVLGSEKDVYQIEIDDNVVFVEPQNGLFTTYIEKENF